jgi:hypothetical protein
MNDIPDGWHRFAKDDAWREVQLAHIEDLGVRLWLSATLASTPPTPSGGPSPTSIKSR